jgi:hypothetical protein
MTLTSGFVKTLHILIVVLPGCGLQLHGQSIDARTPQGAAARSVAALRARLAAVSAPATSASIPLSKAAGTFITFDAPGAGNTAFNGTYSVSINPAGEILGYSFDSSGAPTGFLRDRNGAFTIFDIAGATFFNIGGYGPPGRSLNPAGDAAGFYYDANALAHGFVRDERGAITTFDVSGAGSGSTQGTLPLAINAGGEVAGYYYDSNSYAHGFSRDANGKVTEFDAPGASAGCPFGLTYPDGINAAREITGYYYDSQCVFHGFLRERNGAITVVDAPGYYTLPQSINGRGEIAGIATDAMGGGHAFIRDKRGSFTIFDVPAVCCYMDINSPGVIVGSYSDANSVIHGFRRGVDGDITIIDAPGAGTGTFQGTYASSINPAGEITGNYLDTNNVAHGFLFRSDEDSHY